jgi:elongation factor 1 alpha-like protein
VSKLLSTADRSTGKVKKSPRVLTKGLSADVQITLRSAGGTGKAYSVPLETFKTNKEMGRVLIRRGGETIAAGRWHFSSLPSVLLPWPLSHGGKGDDACLT